MSAREGAFRASPQRAEAIARALVASVPRLESLYLRKVSARGKLLEPVGDPLVGPPCEEVVLCRERGLTYVIRPLHGLSPGLFLDQRHNRARVLERSAGARVLNTFAHTCGFSVAAAAGGAAEVVSVDASRRYLDWGRENLAANGFAADAQTFVAGDVLQYMSRAQRQGRLFDLIVLDPPTFGRDKKSGKTFSITKDLRALLEHTAKVAAPGADVLLCTNHRATSGRDLRSALDLAVGRKGWSFVDEPRLPPDFAMDPQFAKTLWVRFE
jgi:23S rRNA (cytosine1962-C5)-methyltransferase